jgi:hypothetical protein
LPTRLIDVGADGGSLPKLVLTLPGDEGKWVSLTHVWGKELPQQPRFTSTTQNLQDRMLQLDLTDMPAAFRNAILVTRKLGIRYLWIDSLCILQDSHDQSDWKLEDTRMAEYYGNALVTIVADYAEGDYEGFLNTRKDYKPAI